MRLDQLHADADVGRRHSLPLAAAPQPHYADALAPDDWRPAGAAASRDACARAFDAAMRAADDAGSAHEPMAERAPLFDAGDAPWPAPPPPTGAACARTSWRDRLARLAAEAHSSRSASGSVDNVAPSPRQVNIAPWLAAGVIGIVLLALAAGLISHRRIDAEAAQVVQEKRQAAEQALALLHAADRSTQSAVTPLTVTMPADAPATGANAAPATDPARHDAMLAAIKGGSVLASLPPASLVQPSALPAELLPLRTTAHAGTARDDAARAPRPPKTVALLVEGAAAPARAAPADPLAATTIRGTLKGAATPRHRVYQLRETDGEWLGFVARAESDPLAGGVWAGSGDLLAGGWRVAEVTSQGLTLVGANGALEILRP